MLRRFRNTNPVLNPMNDAQMAMLVRANQLVTNNQPGQAAPLFASLAVQMENSNHPRRAANLHARAAHAYADSQDEALALAHAQSALRLFIRWQMTARTPVFYANITRKMNARGMPSAVAALQKEFGAAAVGAPAAQPTPQRHGSLPTACPKCGAPLRSDEATWVDVQTAECEFCGALVKAE